jgi:16S rRNA (adenine1518-N6/adenine1519-N6)-dimethyltransferase
MPQSLTQIKTLLEQHGLSPSRALGQNFLHDANAVGKVVSAGLPASDVAAGGPIVLEVGPGTGTLTEALLEAGAVVVAVELDRGLAGLLRDRLGGRERFTLVEGDVLAGKRELSPAVVEAVRGVGGAGSSATDVALPEGAMPGFRLVANLPYQVASPLLILLAERAAAAPAQAEMLGGAVTVQREVADRLVAGPAQGKAYGPMSVLVGNAFELERVAVLKPGHFWPPPKVDSAILRLTRRPAPICDDVAGLNTLVHTLFGQRRKQIGSLLKRGHGEIDWPNGTRPDMRAGELTCRQLAELVHAVRPGS